MHPMYLRRTIREKPYSNPPECRYLEKRLIGDEQVYECDLRYGFCEYEYGGSCEDFEEVNDGNGDRKLERYDIRMC